MNNRFDYKESINNIKASLFDIYENQEQMIGLEENENIRNTRLNEFVELKNITNSLINKIELLYESNLGINNIQEPSANNYVDEQPIEEQENIEGNEVELPAEDVEEPTIVESSIEEVEQPEIEQEEPIEENEGIEADYNDNTIDEEGNTEELKKYYLNCDFSKINFAFVPQEIYDKIKKYETLDGSFNEEIETSSEDVEEENTIVDNHFYKQDGETPKGIIVRSDQYMKLALSRHRQAGVLEEAKEYRKEEVKRRQRENQKKELEKAELKFDI